MIFQRLNFVWCRYLQGHDLKIFSTKIDVWVKLTQCVPRGLSLKRSALYRVRHMKCYRAIALKLLIISKNVSDKSFSVREGRHTGPPYFFIGGCRYLQDQYWPWRYLKISDKIESLENHNWRTRHSKNLVQCSFSSLSNSLETHFLIFFLTSLRDFIRYVSIFRLFSYFVWLEWPCVVGRRIRPKIGNNVIEKKYMVPFEKVEFTLT